MRCIIANCVPSAAVSLHRFPQDEHLFELWCSRIDAGKRLFESIHPENARLCSKHFRDVDILLINGKRQLISGAIPFLSTNVATSQNHTMLPAMESAAASYVDYAAGKFSTSSASLQQKVPAGKLTGRDRSPLRKLENVPNPERARSRTPLLSAASTGRDNVPLEEQEDMANSARAMSRTPMHSAAPSERGKRKLENVPATGQGTQQPGTATGSRENVPLQELAHVPGRFPLRNLENVPNRERARSRTPQFSAASTGRDNVPLQELAHVPGRFPLRNLENVPNRERARSRTPQFSAASTSRDNVLLEEQEDVANSARAMSRTPMHSAAPSERGKRKLENVPATGQGTQQPGTATGRRKRIRYAGDIKDPANLCPEDSVRAIRVLQDQLDKSNLRNNRLKQKNLRLQKKIQSYDDIITALKSRNLIGKCGELVLEKLKINNNELISAITDGTKGREYSDTVRDFSSTLHFYSARAYKYVRKVFGKTLPDVRTIGKWHARVEAEPGVTPQALAVLAGEKDRRGNKPLLVGLEMDECAVRQHVEWNKYQRKNEGTVDHPSVDRTGEEVMPAKEALVFMASSLDDTWKVPVAYYFINGLKAQEKKAIVETVLAELQNVCAQVVGFTFDGTPTNIAVANMLGCNLGVNEAEMRTSFPHPTAGHNVYVLLDPVHMLKLIRNNLHKQAVFKTANGEVCWKYIKDLYEAQSNGGLALAPKLPDLHVNFQNVKMKADLAIQTISQSVADALLVMKSTNPNFEGAGPTAEFLAVMNDTFDFLNSKDNEESGFKKPIDADNFYIIQPALKYAQEYIKSICLQSGESVLKSRCKTGFLGFLVDIISVQNMYKEYVEEKQLLTCIPVYRLSQDHVETFFGAIRSMGGNNDNPSTICFKSAYKRLLLHNSISGTSKMNVALDDSRILADRPKGISNASTQSLRAMLLKTSEFNTQSRCFRVLMTTWSPEAPRSAL
ncbi:hypothetical protein quinque_007671 [Culex quinquefasciatus]